METASRRLCAKLDVTAPVFAAVAERLWTSPRVREIYPVYLATMHMVARAAVPLMQAALNRAEAQARHDPLAAALADFLPDHIERTLGHDTRLLDDLAATGADPGIPLLAIPSPRVASLVGAHYYWIYHHHPIALLGYIVAIDSHPPAPGFVARLQAQTCFPDAAYRTLARREQLGGDRARELHAWIDELPITRRHETLLGLSALHTVNVGIEVLEEIHDRVVLRPG